MTDTFDKPIQTKTKNHSKLCPLEAENNGKRQEKPATTLRPGKELPGTSDVTAILDISCTHTGLQEGMI